MGRDLAEARTAAIRHATGDWVLVLDADEQLAEGAGEIIRAAIEAGGLDYGYLPLVRVEGPSDTFDPADMDEDSFSVPRLLRRTIDLRWDAGDAESVNGWIAVRARRVRVVDAPIVKAADMAPEEATPVLDIEASAPPADGRSSSHRGPKPRRTLWLPHQPIPSMRCSFAPGTDTTTTIWMARVPRSRRSGHS